MSIEIHPFVRNFSRIEEAVKAGNFEPLKEALRILTSFSDPQVLKTCKCAPLLPLMEIGADASDEIRQTAKKVVDLFRSKKALADLPQNFTFITKGGPVTGNKSLYGLSNDVYFRDLFYDSKIDRSGFSKEACEFEKRWFEQDFDAKKLTLKLAMEVFKLAKQTQEKGLEAKIFDWLDNYATFISRDDDLIEFYNNCKSEALELIQKSVTYYLRANGINCNQNLLIYPSLTQINNKKVQEIIVETMIICCPTVESLEHLSWELMFPSLFQQINSLSLEIPKMDSTFIDSCIYQLNEIRKKLAPNCNLSLLFHNFGLKDFPRTVSCKIEIPLKMTVLSVQSCSGRIVGNMKPLGSFEIDVNGIVNFA